MRNRCPKEFAMRIKVRKNGRMVKPRALEKRKSRNRESEKNRRLPQGAKSAFGAPGFTRLSALCVLINVRNLSTAQAKRNEMQFDADLSRAFFGSARRVWIWKEMP